MSAQRHRNSASLVDSALIAPNTPHQVRCRKLPSQPRRRLRRTCLAVCSTARKGSSPLASTTLLAHRTVPERILHMPARTRGEASYICPRARVANNLEMWHPSNTPLAFVHESGGLGFKGTADITPVLHLRGIAVCKRRRPTWASFWKANSFN